MLRPQLGISCMAALVVIGGISVLVPYIGILGAGIALLASELVVSAGYMVYAQRWLKNNSLTWPKKAFGIAVSSVCVSALSMGSLIVFPQMKWLILGLSMIVLGWNLWRYWHVLPALASEKARQLIIKIPGLKLFFG